MPVMYEVSVRGSYEESMDFDTLAEAKQHALWMAAKRRSSAYKYAAGSIESMQSNGWSAPVDVVRRTYTATHSGARILDGKSRRVFSAEVSQ